MGYSQNPLGPRERRVHDRLQNDLRYFCKTALRIKLKEGGTAPFIWNKAQEYLHERIEAQLQRTGMVRMFIIKGRQQGISTYIAARLYHKITRHRGKNVFILSHQANTTETLFQIVERYHDNCPREITPKCIVNNRRQMRFENQSQYTVGTAGSASIGRGDTNQYFHGSEVAFYENTNDINTGVSQTVPDIPNTEKFMESTANGIGNFFHQGCMDALAGKGLYELVFIPWYWQPEYVARITDDDLLDGNCTEEEQELADLYSLTTEQIQWRRNKIVELKSDNLFKQEYPFTVEEAFIHSGTKLVDPVNIAKARKSRITDPQSPIIIGCDPAPHNDRNVINIRQGAHWIACYRYKGLDQMQMADKLLMFIDRYKADKCFVDVGEGRGIVARLHQLGYEKIVSPVVFGSKPRDDERYMNKRAEMAGDVRDWFDSELGVRMPDDEECAIDCAAIPDFEVTSRGLRQLPSKDKIKKEFGKSPDIFDALMLTFAQPVRRELAGRNRSKRMTTTTKSGSALHAVRSRQASQKTKETTVWDDWDDEDNKIRVKKR